MTDTTMDRTVLRISGDVAFKFLQDLITNDLNHAKSGWCYGALLNAQGKFLVDFFIIQQDHSFFLDAPKAHAQSLMAKLNLYKLRAPVSIQVTSLYVNRGIGQGPDGAYPDPRNPAMGWRQLSTTANADQTLDWLALRIAHSIPQIDTELYPNESYILEYGFARLNGVDFTKGCYVGQEVTARMHHKTQLRKGMMRVDIEGHAPLGTQIICDGKPAGTLHSQHNGVALAHLRFDRIGQNMRANDARVSLPATA